jgi:hypothetical protein
LKNEARILEQSAHCNTGLSENNNGKQDSVPETKITNSLRPATFNYVATKLNLYYIYTVT